MRNGLIALLLMVLPARLLACSLCQGSFQKQFTLRQELGQAKIVLSGPLTNPRLNPQNPNAGGLTDLVIDKVYKSDPWLEGRKLITLPRYVFVDAKNPPVFLVFCDLFNDRLDPYRGDVIKTASAVDYLRKLEALKSATATTALKFFFEHLDSDDPLVSTDAFLEFAKASDADIGRVAKELNAVKLRKLLADEKTPIERLGVYAFLLGACGGEDDAVFLARLLNDGSDRSRAAFSGLLSGYIELRPDDGWKLVASILADPKKPLSDRLTVLNAVRFFQGWKPDAVKPVVLALYRRVLEQGELADLVIEDLRRWQWWDLTEVIVPLTELKSHQSQLIRRAIIRYSLSAPGPVSQAAVSKLRQKDPELVGEVEEYLREFETTIPPK